MSCPAGGADTASLASHCRSVRQIKETGDEPKLEFTAERTGSIAKNQAPDLCIDGNNLWQRDHIPVAAAGV
ncbi:hypothetical protein EDC40_108179 [Aminobacter aminovorans]|uniref:Uncharacterized protein n=1 Tax=Aminobacter aminovorans TaxID=83263 RepID=A0A381IN19_AMIAI|nr:hypothetical protein [Aminobacter aminovorans]TCS24640.1 hypothetical protein EDC40_108179 [Aminobacter aminovorans]SUY29285.1 Uncharacterised protein [Aminobacter aminovorans]